MDQESKKFSKYRLWCTKPSEATKQNVDDLSHESDNVNDESSNPPVLSRSVSCNSNEVEEESQTKFLSLFGLVTLETGEKIKKKSLERKKRSCSSPHLLSLILQAEKQDLDGNDPPAVKTRKKKSDETKKKKEKLKPVTPPTSTPQAVPLSEQKIVTIQSTGFEDGIEDYHEELCHKCSNVGELLLCDTCPLVFHLECAQMTEIPSGKWFCKKCEEKIHDLQFPEFSSETIQQQFEDFQRQRNVQLKEAFILRSEKADLFRKINEMNAVLKSKNELEKTYLSKIESKQLLLNSIDVFMADIV